MLKKKYITTSAASSGTVQLSKGCFEISVQRAAIYSLPNGSIQFWQSDLCYRVVTWYQQQVCKHIDWGFLKRNWDSRWTCKLARLEAMMGSSLTIPWEWGCEWQRVLLVLDRRKITSLHLQMWCLRIAWSSVSCAGSNIWQKTVPSITM